MTEPSLPGVLSDLAQRHFEGFADDVHADLGIFIVHFQLEQVRDGVDQGHATARHDAFFNRSTRGREGVFDAVLLFFQLGLGGCAHTDDGYAAGQLGQALLQFFLVVIAGALIDLDADLLDAAFDLGRLAFTADRSWYRPW